MPIIFEPKPPLSKSFNEVWIVTAGGANWGGANVFVSLDNETYKYVGAVYAGARLGELSTPLAAFIGVNPEVGPALQVDLSASLGQMLSSSDMAAANSVTLCYCDGELLAYTTATLTTAYHYNLTGLYRGLFGTTANAHDAGSIFAFIGIESAPTGCYKYTYPSNLVGAEIFIKLQSFNKFAAMAEDLEDLTPFTYTLNGAGTVQPTNVAFSFAGIPQNTVPILNYTFGAMDTFPVNFAGSICTSGTAATSSTTFNMAKNGANFGTMIFGAAANSAVFSGPAEAFIGGDILKITPTRTDATLANLTGNLAGIT